MTNEGNQPQDRPFVTRAAIIIGLATLAIIALYVLHHLAQMLLVVFGGILFGVLLDGILKRVESGVSIPRYISLPLLLIVIIGILVGIGFMAGPRISDQFDKLTERIPEALTQIQTFLREREWGQAILGAISAPDTLLPSSTAILGRITGIFSTAAGAITGGLIILFVGVYLAANPGLYRENALRLISAKKRERAREVVRSLGNALRWWLAGRFLSMFVVGLLTAIALWIFGIPLAFSLGLIAALLSFVPFIGPISSAIPAILVALAEDPILVIWVIVIYSGVQFLESYFITPFIQQRAVSVPPALLITAQVLMGVLFGLVGVFLATPLLVVIIVMIQLLYVEDILGEKAHVMGEH